MNYLIGKKINTRTMNQIYLKRLMNAVGQKVKVSYENDKTTFEIIGALARPADGKFFGVGIASLGKSKATVVFHPQDISNCEQEYTGDHKLNIELKPL